MSTPHSPGRAHISVEVDTSEAIAKIDALQAKVDKLQASMDMFRCSLDGRALGQVAFEAYNNHGPNAGKTYDGKPIPPWPEIAEHTRDRWEASARAVVRSRFSHAAGNHSDEELRGALSRSVDRFSRECVAHNGPLSLLALVEIIESELRAIGNPFPPPPPPPPPQRDDGGAA